MLIFSNNCALLLKVNNLLENMLIFRKLWLFIHVQIFIRVFLLLKNCYFDSKYDFIRWYFGKSVIFLVKFTFQVALFLSENCDFLCECLYTSRNCRILIKTLIFLRKCLFVHVLIFIKVLYLLENCYFDSKYHFIRWYFGQKCHFLVKFTFQMV